MSSLIGEGEEAIWRTALAARSTGSQSKGWFSSAGRAPVTFTLDSINGHASVMFHIPFWVSPHSCPILNTPIFPLILVVKYACSQMASATHFEREYPREDAELGS